jgi:thiosulfate/3-mercaptopyruvate sulfurtransferase
LPGPKEFAKILSGWGISQDRQVVVYDTANGAFAARLWWMLQALGHSKVAVLNGGFPHWQKFGLSTRPGSESNQPATFSLAENALWTGIVSPREVENIRLDPMYKLIDARSPERYSGDKEPIDSHAGHIPGAVNRYHGENLQMDGTIKPPKVIGKEFNNILEKISPDHTVVYCGSGVTSCFHILAMNYCGLFGAKLYPGSWSEWIKDPARLRYP